MVELAFGGMHAANFAEIRQYIGSHNSMKFTSSTVDKSDSLRPCVVDNGENLHSDFVFSVTDSLEVLETEEPIFL